MRPRRGYLVAGALLVAVSGMGLSGCASSGANQRDDSKHGVEDGELRDDGAPLTPDRGQIERGRTIVFLDVAGPEADDDERSKCQEVADSFDIQTSDNAALTVRLILRDDGNWLRIFTREGRTLYDEPRTDWEVEALCQDALARAVAFQYEQDHPRSPTPVRGSDPGAIHGVDPRITSARGRARALHLEGKADFRAGNFADAIDAWMNAYGLDPRPEFLHNIAGCFQRRADKSGSVEDLKRARQYLLRYAAASPGVKIDPARLSHLDAAIAAADSRRGR